MIEAAQILGCLSAVLLLVAAAAWVKLFRGPELQLLDGSAAPDAGTVEIASQLLMSAVGLSGVAALLAIASLFTT